MKKKWGEDYAPRRVIVPQPEFFARRRDGKARLLPSHDSDVVDISDHAILFGYAMGALSGFLMGLIVSTLWLGS
jgi:hypothetical protein